MRYASTPPANRRTLMNLRHELFALAVAKNAKGKRPDEEVYFRAAGAEHHPALPQASRRAQIVAMIASTRHRRPAARRAHGRPRPTPARAAMTHHRRPTVVLVAAEDRETLSRRSAPRHPNVTLAHIAIFEEGTQLTTITRTWSIPRRASSRAPCA